MRRRPVVLPALLVAVALMAGCSSDQKATSAASTASTTSSAQTSSATDLTSLSAEELLAKSAAALNAADQIHVKGTVIEQGEKISIDYGFTKTGSSGSITLSGKKIELIAVDNAVYFRAPAAFWAEFGGANAAAVLKVVSGKWIKVAPGDKNFADFTGLADRTAFTKDFLTPEGKPKLGTPKTVNGVDCLALEDTKGGTLYVAKDDARPIQVVGKSGASAGLINISYDGVAEPTAPPASDVIDSSKFGA